MGPLPSLLVIVHVSMLTIQRFTGYKLYVLLPVCFRRMHVQRYASIAAKAVFNGPRRYMIESGGGV